jgi:hypothetical protein
MPTKVTASLRCGRAMPWILLVLAAGFLRQD